LFLFFSFGVKPGLCGLCTAVVQKFHRLRTDEPYATSAASRGPILLFAWGCFAMLFPGLPCSTGRPKLAVASGTALSADQDRRDPRACGFRKGTLPRAGGFCPSAIRRKRCRCLLWILTGIQVLRLSLLGEDRLRIETGMLHGSSEISIAYARISCVIWSS